MGNHSMLNMTLTLFKRVETDDDVVFRPVQLSNCFIKVTHGVYYKEQGTVPKARDESLAVIPLSSLSSLDEVPPNTPVPQKYWGTGIIRENDYIALGSYTDEQYLSNQIAVLPECFCIKVFSKFDFSSIPCYLLKGE